MKKFFLSALLILPLTLSADTDIFQRFFGGQHNDFSAAVQQTIDGGFVSRIEASRIVLELAKFIHGGWKSGQHQRQSAQQRRGIGWWRTRESLFAQFGVHKLINVSFSVSFAGRFHVVMDQRLKRPVLSLALAQVVACFVLSCSRA